MAGEPAFEGFIPEEGVGDVLGGLEEIGTTGVLAFHGAAGSGTIQLVQGRVAGNGATAEQERALETLLSLRDGQFAVYAKLPHLPISRGTDTTRRGSLGVHPPPELMRYCENAGLTGRLLLEQRGRLAIGYYDRGELKDVSIDGGTAADFVSSLEWTEGTFRVDSVPPPLEALPLSLRQVTAESAPRSDPTQIRTGRADETPVSRLRPKAQDDEDPTIRIVRRPGEDELDSAGEGWNALDYSPSFPSESATTEAVTEKDDGRPLGFWRTVGWVGAVFLVVAGCLWLLASLPPLE